MILLLEETMKLLWAVSYNQGIELVKEKESNKNIQTMFAIEASQVLDLFIHCLKQWQPI